MGVTVAVMATVGLEIFCVFTGWDVSVGRLLVGPPPCAVDDVGEAEARKEQPKIKTAIKQNAHRRGFISPP